LLTFYLSFHMSKEKDFQTLFSEYNSVKKLIGNFELKDSLGKPSLPYDCFEEHQIPSLLAAEIDGYRHKYSDMDIRLKPFDYSSNPPVQGWIGIRFNRTAYLIHVKKFIAYRDVSPKKSITEDEAFLICEIAVEL
jgi:hypothetical protein